MPYKFNPFTGTFDDSTPGPAGAITAVPAGTAAAPSVAFEGDANTGIYSPGADQVAISTSGTEKLIVKSDGKVGLGTSSPNGPLEVIGTAATIAARATTEVSSKAIQIYNDGTDSYIDSTAYGAGSGGGIAFRRNGTGEMGRFDTSGRLLVGTSTSATTALLQVRGNSAAATNPGTFYLFPNYAPASLGAGDMLARLQAGANDGSVGATIDFVCDATWGSGDYPTRLVFSTAADGAASPTEAMRIKSTQIINFSNAPTHADNTAATAAGLAVGDVYKTVLGVLMIRF